MDTSNPSQSKRKTSATRRRAAGEAEAFLVCLNAREDALPFSGSPAGNARGRVLEACWRELGRSHACLLPDSVAVGPRCVQGILSVSRQDPEGLSLADAMRLFKVIAARRLSETGGGRGSEAPGGLWKRGFAERSLSGARELAAARKALKSPKIP